MGRRQEVQTGRKTAGQAEGPDASPTDLWIRWRPRPKPIFLGLSLLLLLAWVGFLVAMIYVK